MSIPLYDASIGLKRFCTTNLTTASITDLTPSLTEPSGNGIITVPPGGGRTYRWAMLIFFGIGSDNHTIDYRLTGWKHGPSGFVPITLAQLTATLSTAVGIASGDVLATERFADTLASLTFATDGTDAILRSNAADVAAHLLVDTKGMDLLQLQLAKGSATSGNALVIFLQ